MNTTYESINKLNGGFMKDLSNEVILHKECNGTEYIQFKKLLEYPEIQHCFTLRKNELNFKGEDLEKSYEKVKEVFQVDKEKIVKPHQTHTDKVEIVTKSTDSFSEVDGLITDKENIVLCTTEADCTGLLLYDPIQKVIGDVHSGWRGTLQKIGQKAVKRMIETYHSKPEDIICCICPHIRKCHFEVEEDVKNLFEKEFCYIGKLNEIIIEGDKENREGREIQKYYIDTCLINKIILQEVGLKLENIIDSGICTVCDSDSFHSYRVDKLQSGRNATMIMIKGEEKCLKD